MNEAPDEPQPQPSLPARYVSPRHDGWTVERQEKFLKALAACGCITDACRAVGMSRQSAHNLYNNPQATDFRRAFDAALDSAIPTAVEAGAWERTIKGVPRPVFYRGEQVGEYRHYDERLTMFLLRYRRPHRYRDLPVPPVVHPPGWEEDGPDPDAAIGALDWQLGGLVDEAELPGGMSEPERSRDGVNFVNFVGNEDAPNRHPGPEPGPDLS